MLLTPCDESGCCTVDARDGKEQRDVAHARKHRAVEHRVSDESDRRAHHRAHSALSVSIRVPRRDDREEERRDERRNREELRLDRIVSESRNDGRDEVGEGVEGRSESPHRDPEDEDVRARQRVPDFFPAEAFVVDRFLTSRRVDGEAKSDELSLSGREESASRGRSGKEEEEKDSEKNGEEALLFKRESQKR